MTKKPESTARGLSRVLSFTADSIPSAGAGFYWCYDDLAAVKIALATGRPLLLRGEPGVGKTSLASAVALAVSVPLVTHACDSRTEPEDFFWRTDSIARLAEAQLCGALPEAERDATKLRNRLHVANFVEPGCLWWAYDWHSASQLPRASTRPTPDGWSPEWGVVALIDEIDKAEPEVANSLLDAMAERRIRRPDGGYVEGSSSRFLLVFTTNDERALPEPFLRRCVVHTLAIPKEHEASVRWLRPRLESHGFHARDHEDEINTFLKARSITGTGQRRAPGLAELLDFLTALRELDSLGARDSALREMLEKLIFRKT